MKKKSTSPKRTVKELKEELLIALEESVKTQSHYAKLLNQYDGGKRQEFKSAEEWMDRLRKLNCFTAFSE
jgi:hypothetical protein